MSSSYYHSKPQDIREAELRGTYRRFGNSERNQRLSFPLGQLRDKPVWESALPDHITPQDVMAGSGCVVVNAVEGWLLFDAAGKLLHRGYAGAGEVTLDARARLLYAATDTGYVGAFSLDDGKRRFYLTPLFGHEFSRDFIQRAGTQMIIASIERRRPSHSRVPANMSVIEIQDLSRPPEIDSSGWLESAERTKYLKRQTIHLRVAMHGDELALATDNSLSLTDLTLQLQREFTGSFRPLWLSVDELMNSYLIVRTGNKLALWVVTREGERVVNVPLPEGVHPIGPPVVGRDHTTYVIASHHVIAIDALGTICWENQEASEIAGAAVTADDHLLIAAGAELVAYGPGGKRIPLLTAQNDTFLTAPANGDNGELFIAGARSLFALC